MIQKVIAETSLPGNHSFALVLTSKRLTTVGTKCRS